MKSDNAAPRAVRAGARRLTRVQFDRIARALAEPRRVAVLEAIAADAGCPCRSLLCELGLAKATISHHLKALTDAGLVVTERDGKFVRCRIRHDVVAAFSAELARRTGLAPVRPARRRTVR